MTEHAEAAPDVRAFLDRVVAVATDDTRIDAILLLGSHATGTADAHSDVDIGLVATDAGHADLVAGLPDVVAAIGRPLLAETFEDPTNIHVIYADGVACELIVLRAAEVDPGRPHRVLLDRTGMMRTASASPAEASPAVVEAERVRQLVAWFWHDLEHVLAAIGRGQPVWAHGQLEELRGVCLELGRIAAGAELEDGEPYWKVDLALAPETLEALRATIVPAEAADQLAATRALVALYRELARPLAAAHGIAYPTELDTLLAAQLDRLAGAP